MDQSIRRHQTGPCNWTANTPAHTQPSTPPCTLSHQQAWTGSAPKRACSPSTSDEPAHTWPPNGPAHTQAPNGPANTRPPNRPAQTRPQIGPAYSWPPNGPTHTLLRDWHTPALPLMGLLTLGRQMGLCILGHQTGPPTLCHQWACPYLSQLGLKNLVTNWPTST